MAKDKGEPSQGEDKKAPGVSKKAKGAVKASTSDKELVKLDKDGAELRWDFEDFRTLDGSILDKLSRGSLDSYFVELGLYRRRLARESDEAEYGKFPVIEVLGRSASVRQRVEGLPEGLHPYWASPEEIGDRQRAGYVTVDTDRFPDVRAGDAVLGTQRKTKTRKGEDEAVLMACPADVYGDHIQGMSAQSGENVKARQEEGKERILEMTGTRSTSPSSREETPVKIRVPRGN